MIKTAQAGRTTYRVLVLEDNLNDQDMIRRAMRRVYPDAQINFVTTISGARQSLQQNRFNAILCDNSVPDGMGSDFARELAREPRYIGTPIALISGWPSPFMWDKARQAGLKVIDKTDNPMAKLHDFFRKCFGAPQPAGM